MKYKETWEERLRREYKENLDLRVKTILGDLDRSYFPDHQKPEVTITDIFRTEEEQKSYYPEYFKEHGVVKPTYHILKNTCAVDIRLTGFNSEETDALVIYLVNKWHGVFGLRCLPHEVKVDGKSFGWHLHIQVSPPTIEASEQQMSNYLANRFSEEDIVEKYFDRNLRKVKPELELLAVNMEHLLSQATNIKDDKGFITVDAKTQKKIIEGAVALTVELSGLTFLQYIPKSIRQIVINAILGYILKGIIKEK